MMKSSQEQQQRRAEVSRKTQIILATIDQALKSLKGDTLTQSNHNYLHRISLNLDLTKVENVLNNLNQGYLVKKHSPSTDQFHVKFLYISDDHRFLCWKSLEKTDEKRIQLNRIESVCIQRKASYIIKSQTLKNYDCSMVVVSNIRNLQIECSSPTECIKLSSELQQAIKNSRRMHLSYKF